MGWAPVILISPRMYALQAPIYLSLGQRPRRRYATISSAEGASHVSPMLTSGYAVIIHDSRLQRLAIENTFYLGRCPQATDESRRRR
jgi:hypothetical protein